MILQSHTNFDQLAAFDPNLQSVRFLSRKHHPELSTSIVGSFSKVNEMMVSFYRDRGDLYFSIGNQEFELTDDTRSTLETDGNYRQFQLLKSENVLVNLTYLTPELEIPLSIDPAPFVGSRAECCRHDHAPGYRDEPPGTHFEDDHSWAFLCATTENSDDYRLVSMGELVSLDEGLLSNRGFATRLVRCS